MQSITKTYLTDLLVRTINQTIQIRRVSQHKQLPYLQYTTATTDELLDFIASIPYFDEGLKNFLMGKQNDTIIIISQAWETSFMVRAKAWAESEAWLYINPIFAIGFSTQQLTREKDSLTLPY
jgi:hypothetical protein